MRPRRMCCFLRMRTGTSTRCACGKGRAQFPTQIRIGDQETSGACRAGEDEFDVQELRTEGPLGWRSSLSKFCWKSLNAWQLNEAVECQPKGAGKRASFRTRAPFNREVRIAQAVDDETGLCVGRCFKFVSFVPSSDPVPAHAARGVIDPGTRQLQGLHDPEPGRQAVQNFNDPVPGRGKAPYSDDPVPGRQIKKDDLVPGHLGRGPLIIDDEDDEDGNRSWAVVAELARQHSDQRWSRVWKVGMQVRVVDGELEPEIRCGGWMAVKDNVASVDILAQAVAESELDDGLAMEEPARRARLGRHPEQQHVFQFGKYRNERYEDVTEETPDYYFWGSQERKPSKYLQHYLEWVTEHYVVDPVRSTLTSKATGRIHRQKVRSRQSRSSRSLCARKGGSKQRNVFPSATRGTQQELVPMQHTSVLRACSAAPSHK